MKKIITLIISINLLILFLFPGPALAFGVAIGPQSLELQDTIRGQQYERVVTVFNTGEDESYYTVRGTDVAGAWLSFYNLDTGEPLDRFLLPGHGKLVVLIKVTIPEDVTNNTYTAMIYAETAPPESIGGASAKLQSACKLVISVTGEQKIAGTVGSITVRDAELGSPARLVVNFRNTGNVMATPLVECRFIMDGATIATLTNDNTSVKAGSSGDIYIDWDTNGVKTGAYTADVTVSLGGNVLATQTATFQVVPLGSFSTSGQLMDLVYQGTAQVGQMGKLLATFKNSGVSDIRARLKIEVEKDGSLVDVIESEETLVRLADTGTLTAYFKPTEKGVYTFNGIVTYSGKQTDGKAITIDLTGETGQQQQQQQQSNSEDGSSGLPWPIIGGAGGGVLVIAIVIFLISKR